MPGDNIKLWYLPGSCALAPHILLREIGKDFELVEMTMEKLSGEYDAINPKRRVPALALNSNEIITENPAVMLAISNLAPEKHLMGKTQMDTVRAIEWGTWLSGTMHGQAFAGVWRPHRFIGEPEFYDKIKAQGMITIKESFKFIEDKLSGLHAVGDEFTGTDAYLFAIYRWGQTIKLPMASDYPKLTALVLEVSKRESAIAALKAEGRPPFTVQ
ncbi:glutathione S-transferase [Arthroderma uncinatum]|uniref:glutathione S-transferase n=1 Tax=Arthroderma uncinatum TaxID=74035 RepID=UPI00144A4D61|nr:glutathione S-transferase [Arthroderma uncinatum]KAF3481977.1 glutathione S-transferase [Arthroderma uncinatum]